MQVVGGCFLVALSSSTRNFFSNFTSIRAAKTVIATEDSTISRRSGSLGGGSGAGVGSGVRLGVAREPNIDAKKPPPEVVVCLVLGSLGGTRGFSVPV